MKTRTDPSTKPYYRCLSCAKFRSACGGIPTRDLDLQNWCEYMRDVKELAHLTNAFIAEKADVSIKTIERIMAINCDTDIRRATARRIEQVVIGPVAKYFCDMDYDSSAATDRINQLLAEIGNLKEENAYWRRENDLKAKIIEKYIG